MVMVWRVSTLRAVAGSATLALNKMSWLSRLFRNPDIALRAMCAWSIFGDHWGGHQILWLKSPFAATKCIESNTPATLADQPMFYDPCGIVQLWVDHKPLNSNPRPASQKWAVGTLRNSKSIKNLTDFIDVDLWSLQ
mmetsp:Transcript_30868/g.50257  ORF Transcript_30868/g.50257 Transcript_30868/m.50257 type:complete len:137 (-) Transcript_30868:1230-1640(-)